MALIENTLYLPMLYNCMHHARYVAAQHIKTMTVTKQVHCTGHMPCRPVLCRTFLTNIHTRPPQIQLLEMRACVSLRVLPLRNLLEYEEMNRLFLGLSVAAASANVIRYTLRSVITKFT